MADETTPRWLRVAAAWAWRVVAVAAALLVLGYVVYRLRLVVLPVVFALFATAALAPIARRLRRAGAPDAVAALGALAVAAAAIAALGLLVAPAVASEFDSVGRDARAGVEQVGEWLAEGPLGLEEREIERYVDRGLGELRERSGSIAGGVAAGAVLVAEVVAGLLLMIVVLFFFLKDGERIWRAAVGLLPPRRRPQAEAAGEEAWQTLGGYLRGVAIIALVDAVLIGIVLLVLRVPLVLPLMALTFVGAFFPIVGAFLAGAVAVLVALVTGGVVDAVIVAIAITLIQQLEGDVLYPLVVGRAVRLHPLAILLALTAGALVAGVVGAFLAVPALAVAVAAAARLREAPA